MFSYMVGHILQIKLEHEARERDKKKIKLARVDGNLCGFCIHDGNQMIFRSGCTGCSAKKEYGNFKRKGDLDG